MIAPYQIISFSDANRLFNSKTLPYFAAPPANRLDRLNLGYFNHKNRYQTLDISPFRIYNKVIFYCFDFIHGIGCKIAILPCKISTGAILLSIPCIYVYVLTGESI